MTAAVTTPEAHSLTPHPRRLSPRIQRLRNYYFQGADRRWNNRFLAWSTGTPWDVQFNEMTYYSVPETYPLLQTLRGSFRKAARDVALPPDFWSRSLPERRPWFVKTVMVDHVPREILPGDLLAGARFNLQTSLCLSEDEQRAFDRLLLGTNGARVKWFHDHGYGDTGATQRQPRSSQVTPWPWKGMEDVLVRGPWADLPGSPPGAGHRVLAFDGIDIEILGRRPPSLRFHFSL